MVKLYEPIVDKIHEVKCIEPYFSQCKHGFKDFDVRKDDRDYQVNDFLKLRKFDPKTNTYVKGESLLLVE